MDDGGDSLEELIAEREALNPEFRVMVARAHARRILGDSLTPAGTDQWLRARNRLLDGERPDDILEAGEFDRVLAAARAFIDGGYS